MDLKAYKRPKSRQTVLRWIGSVLALSLLVYLLSRQGWGEILAAMRQIPLWRFLLALGLVGGSRLAVASRWYTLLGSTSAGISRRQSITITFAGLFASNFLPTTIGGDVVRLAATLQLGSDRAVCAASIVADRLVGLLGMATALPLGLGPLLAWLPIRGQAGAEFPGILSLALASSSRVSRITGKIRALIRRLLAALSYWLTQPRALLTSLAYTWLHMLFKFTAILVLSAGMGHPISLWLVAGLWSFTYFVTLLPISINGLGVQEISMTFIFTNFGGVPLSVGLTLALLIRTIEMAASLPGALFLPGILAGRDELPTA